MDPSPTRILVVDDEKSIRDGCRIVLEEEGYFVDVAEDAAEAQKKLLASPYDLAVIDLKLPGMSGVELISLLKDNEILLSIAITGHASISNAVQVMKSGAYDYLTKPFTPEELTYIVRRAEHTVKLRKFQHDYAEERARGLKDLASEKGRLKTILESIADGIVVTDPIGDVVLTNHAIDSLATGPAAEELKGKTNALIRKLIGESSGPMSKIVEEITLGPNEETTLSVVCSPVHNETGETIGAVAALRDITENKELDRAKFNFVRMVTHELKAPVGAIQGYIDLILDGLLDDNPAKQREALERSRDRAASLLKLIGDLLSVMKMRSGLVRRTFETVDLQPIARDIAQLLKVDADRGEIALGVEAEPGFPPIEADRSNMEELITNLISNAVKYNKKGGAVALRLKRDGSSRVIIECADTGIGIPPDSLAHLFDEFYRVRNESTLMISGTGLGLSIVKEIIDAHGGKIEVESTLGKGSLFRVALPVRHAFA